MKTNKTRWRDSLMHTAHKRICRRKNKHGNKSIWANEHTYIWYAMLGMPPKSWQHTKTSTKRKKKRTVWKANKLFLRRLRFSHFFSCCALLSLSFCLFSLLAVAAVNSAVAKINKRLCRAGCWKIVGRLARVWTKWLLGSSADFATFSHIMNIIDYTYCLI